MAPLDLTAMQWRPVAMLYRGRADTPAELARLTGTDTGAMTRTLDRLEAKGLLRRNRSQTDRRVVKLELTELGETKAREIPNNIAHVLRSSPARLQRRRGAATQALHDAHAGQRLGL